jgi:hypothetical protein
MLWAAVTKVNALQTHTPPRLKILSERGNSSTRYLRNSFRHNLLNKPTSLDAESENFGGRPEEAK